MDGVDPQQHHSRRLPGPRSASPLPIRDTEDGQRLLRRDLSSARKRIDDLESQIRHPSGRTNGYKDSDLSSKNVDLKVLRNAPLFTLPGDFSEYRVWKSAVLLGMVGFDNTGEMKEFIMHAMELRGADQIALKFGTLPPMQAMVRA